MLQDFDHETLQLNKVDGRSAGPEYKPICDSHRSVSIDLSWLGIFKSPFSISSLSISFLSSTSRFLVPFENDWCLRNQSRCDDSGGKAPISTFPSRIPGPIGLDSLSSYLETLQNNAIKNILGWFIAIK